MNFNSKGIREVQQMTEGALNEIYERTFKLIQPMIQDVESLKKGLIAMLQAYLKKKEEENNSFLSRFKDLFTPQSTSATASEKKSPDDLEHYFRPHYSDDQKLKAIYSDALQALNGVTDYKAAQKAASEIKKLIDKLSDGNSLRKQLQLVYVNLSHSLELAYNDDASKKDKLFGQKRNSLQNVKSITDNLINSIRHLITYTIENDERISIRTPWGRERITGGNIPQFLLDKWISVCSSSDQDAIFALFDELEHYQLCVYKDLKEQITQQITEARDKYLQVVLKYEGWTQTFISTNISIKKSLPSHALEACHYPDVAPPSYREATSVSTKAMRTSAVPIKGTEDDDEEEEITSTNPKMSMEEVSPQAQAIDNSGVAPHLEAKAKNMQSEARMSESIRTFATLLRKQIEKAAPQDRRDEGGHVYYLDLMGRPCNPF